MLARFRMGFFGVSGANQPPPNDTVRDARDP